MSSETPLNPTVRRLGNVLLALLPALLLVVVAVGPALVGQRIFLAGDLIEQGAPWSETASSTRVLNACVNDTIDSAMPSQMAFRDRVAQGEAWPDFEPRTSAGHPLGASPSVGTSSPLFLATLPFSDTTFTAWLKVLEIAVAVLGCVLWARRIGLSGAAGAVGGFLYATSGFLLMWTNWPQTRTAVFFPLMFWAVERVVQERTLRSVLPLPLVVAGAALGGFPAIVVHAVYACAVYAIVRLVMLERAAWTAPGEPGGSTAAAAPSEAGGSAAVARFSRQVVQRRVWAVPALVALAGAVTLGLVAVQLVPWAAQLGGQDLSYRSSWWARTIEPAWLATTLYAQGLGTCVSFSSWWGGPTIPVEAVSFIGSAAVVLILVGLLGGARVARGVRGVLLAVGLVTLAVTFVGGPFNEVLHHLPGMDNSFMARSRAVGGLCFAMLAAVGLDTLRRGVRPAGRRRRASIVLALLVPPVLLVVALLAAQAARAAGTRRGWDHAEPTVWASLAAGTAMSVVWLAWLLTRRERRRGVRTLAAVVAVAAVSVEGIWAARMWWPLAPVESFYRDVPTSEYLRDRLGDQRIMGVNGTYWLSASTIEGLRGLSGHAFVPPTWAGMLIAADPHSMPAFTRTLTMLSGLDQLGSPVYERMALRYGVTDTTEQSVGRHRGLEDLDSGVATALEPRRAVGAEPVRAVLLGVASRDLSGMRRRCAPDARLVAQVRDAQGEVLAEGQRRLRRPEKGVVSVPVDPVAQEDLARQAQVTARVVGCEDLRYWAADPLGADSDADAGTDADTNTGADRGWAGVIVDPGDGLVQVPPSLTPDALVYENPDALDRFRWASGAAPCSSVDECARLMGEVPGTTAVLHPTVRAQVPFDGRPADVEVLRDDGDEQVVRVDAQGDGMLVVADSVQPGWRVEVDGEPVAMHHADIALRGVAVAAGEHEVRFVYEPAGRDVLVPLAAATAAAWALTAVLLVIRDRRRREP